MSVHNAIRIQTQRDYIVHTAFMQRRVRQHTLYPKNPTNIMGHNDRMQPMQFAQQESTDKNFTPFST